jgi:GNAT superfamily N-acetyltransferase
MGTIRHAHEPDRAALHALASGAGADSPTESLWNHPESELAVYLDPYLDRGTVLVAEADGALVGYLAGADSADFPSEEERMTAAIKRYKLFGKRGPRAFFAKAALDMAAARLRRRPTAGELHDPRWPAHLHINVAPEARGTGVAADLVTRWQDHLRAAGTGCHLQTVVENTRAARFFGKCGFTPHGATPLIPGMRWQGGKLHQLTMVWTP